MSFPPPRSPGVLQRGFSFLEIVIVVVILGVVLAIAAPNYTAMVNGNHLVATGNELLAVVQQARIEAVRRNQRVVVCPSSDGSSCGSDWSLGWLSFQDNNRDDLVSVGEAVITTGVPSTGTRLLPSPAIATENRLRFSPDGFAREPVTGALLAARIAVCRPVSRPEENVRDLVLASGSRASLVRRSGGGTCTQPADT